MVVRVPTATPMPGRRRLIIIVVVVLAALLLAFTALSGFFVDILWFREVRLSDVFWTVFRTKVFLGLALGLTFFVLLYSNLWIVRRITPRYPALTPDQEILERYRMQFEPYVRWLLPLLALVIAFLVGVGATTHWQTYLLWRNGAGLMFGNPEPLFDRDPAFYVFSLPWLQYMQGWLFSSLVWVTLLTAGAHYVWGGIRPQAQGFGEKVSPQVKAHLSVLLGLIMLTKAWGYYLGQFDLLTSTRGVVVGASYTDVNAQLPALRILVVIAIACAILFLVNIRLRGWALPVIAVGLLALVSIIAGAAYPAFVQRFRVAPQEFQREQPFIEDNIEATRRAFELDGITSTSRPVGDAVTSEDAQANDATISNIRLWRPDVLRDNYISLQRFRSYYEFNDVDVDRYVIDGQRRVLMISTREVSQAGIPEGGQTWQNVHLQYTHGFGAVASQVNAATTEGQPVFTLRDIPPIGAPALEGNGQRVYYGEGAPGDAAFVVVDTGTDELDYQGTATDDQAQATFSYDGDGGIPVGGLLQRALFAWRFRDVNLLISDLIQGDSRIMIYRDITARVPKAAPFLRFDADPYSAVVEGRLGMDLGRLYDDGPVPVLGLRRSVGGRVAVCTGAGPLARGGRELPAELGEGGGRRVQRIIALLRCGPGGSHHPSLEPRVPDDVHEHGRGVAGSPRAFPLPGEPLPDPGVRVHELPRHGSQRVLREAGLLGAPDRPHRRRERSGADASVLRADAPAGRG